MKTGLLKTPLYCITLLSFLVAGIANVDAQSINTTWKQDLNNAMEEFMKCRNAGEEKCATYAGQALKKVYNLDDFYSSSMKRYLRASEISEIVRNNKNWTLLGRSFEQNALEQAQENANNKKAVVAVYMDDKGLGHVALIVPGSLTPSGSWGLKVPSAASFVATDPDKSFVDKGLSFAFTKNMMKDVFLYVRNY